MLSVSVAYVVMMYAYCDINCVFVFFLFSISTQRYSIRLSGSFRGGEEKGVEVVVLSLY